MNNLETILIKFFCGENYERCSNKCCKNCKECSFMLGQVVPLKEYLQKVGRAVEINLTGEFRKVIDYKNCAEKLLNLCVHNFRDDQTLLLAKELESIVKSEARRFSELIEFHSVCEFTDDGPEYTITRNGLHEILREEFNMKNNEIYN